MVRPACRTASCILPPGHKGLPLAYVSMCGMTWCNDEYLCYEAERTPVQWRLVPRLRVLLSQPLLWVLVIRGRVYTFVQARLRGGRRPYVERKCNTFLHERNNASRFKRLPF